MRPRTVWLVAMREITERLRGRATWFLTGLTALVAVGLVVLPSVINQHSGSTRIGLVGPQAQALGPAITAAARAARLDITTNDVDSEATAQSELTPSSSPGSGGRLSRLFGGTNARLDAALLVNGNAATIEAHQTIPPGVAPLLRGVLNAVHQHSLLSAAGVPSATIAASETPVPVTTKTLQSSPSNRAGLDIAALASALLLTYGVTGFGSAVATGVAQEKTSRTAEVLVAAVRPQELMTGKVIGIGLVGVGQMAVTVGAALLASSLVKTTVLPPNLGSLLPELVLWFALGFTLYAFGFAAAGAMVARQEEVQSITLPFTAVSAAGLLLAYAAIGSPDSPWIRVLSYVPPLTPVLMPARTWLGHPAVWELPLAVVIELASIAAVAVLAGRIYRSALVRGGARVTWSEALRLGRPSDR